MQIRRSVPRGSLEPLVNPDGINIIVLMNDTIAKTCTGGRLTREFQRQDAEGAYSQ